MKVPIQSPARRTPPGVMSGQRGMRSSIGGAVPPICPPPPQVVSERALVSPLLR